MEFYCTYFDGSYLSRAITLYESMVTHCGSFELHCVCMDEASYERLSSENLPHLRAIPIGQLLEKYPLLKKARDERSLVEFYFTSTASVLDFVFESRPDIGRLTYLDADLYFFGNPDAIFEEVGRDAAAGIIEHRFYGLGKIYRKYGIYNVGWLTFNRNGAGRRCLSEWQSNCFEWCFDRIEGDKYADQKYLDRWPEQHPTVRVIANIGANVGPWNVGQYSLAESKGGYSVDGVEVIFYHFASLKRLSERRFKANTGFYFVRGCEVLFDGVYRDYIECLLRNERFGKIATSPRIRFSFRSLVKQASRWVRGVIFPDVIDFGGTKAE